MEDKQRLESGGDRKVDELGVTLAPHRGNHSDTIHVSLHDVTTQPIVRTHGPLKIDPRSFFPVADSRALECGRDGGDIEPPLAKLANSKTGAVYGDALTIFQVTESRADAKLAPGIGLPHAFHFANLLDRSEERRVG